MKKKILVIEDERATRTNILGFLDSEGFDAIGAENGHLGIQAAKTHIPHLIICDVLMPGLDGYDVLTQLQGDPTTADIPFIFLTVETDRQGLNQGLEMGSDDYLRKPITDERLRSAIKNRLHLQEPVSPQRLNQSPALCVENYLDILEQYPINSADGDLNHYSNNYRNNYISRKFHSIPLGAAKPERSEPDVQQLQQFIEIKDQVFERLFQELIHSAVHLNMKLAELKEHRIAPDNSEYLAELEKELTKIIALTRKGIDLQRTITPKNIELLQQFNFFDVDRL